MTFTPKTWQNLPATSTPISAAALVDMETRLAAYTDGATQNQGPWLGLNGNHVAGFGSTSFWSTLNVSYTRIEQAIGATNTSEGVTLSVDVGNAVTAGCIPIIVIEATSYSGPGSVPIPTGGGITTYANAFVAFVQTIMTNYPNTACLFEILNEPWAYSGATSAQYADLVLGVINACNTASIPLNRIYPMVNTATWINGMYAQQASLGTGSTAVQGWSIHPYGPPPPAWNNAGQGISATPQLRQNFKSGANNIIISEVGFWTPDVNGGASGGINHPSSAYNSTQAAQWLQSLLLTAETFRNAGWLKALLLYSRSDGGWAMNLAGGTLTAQGSVLAAFPQPGYVGNSGLTVQTHQGEWSPVDENGLTVSMAPEAAHDAVQLTGGKIHLFRVRNDTFSFTQRIIGYVDTAGATLTSGQCFAGVYFFPGNNGNVWNLADATLTQHTAWQSSGLQTMTIPGSDNYSPGYLYIALLANGTTMPKWRGVTAGAQLNWGNSGANNSGLYQRSLITTSSAFTTLPTTLDLVSACVVNNSPIFVALS